MTACDDAYDAKKAAELYCDCMRYNDGINKFNAATDICDDELVAENRYYKLFAIDMRDSILDAQISNDTRDSVKLFTYTFIDYIDAHCCEQMWRCRKPGLG